MTSNRDYQFFKDASVLDNFDRRMKGWMSYEHCETIKGLMRMYPNKVIEI